MIRIISLKLAINAMLILLMLVLCYHILIITEVLSHQVAWGGRLETKSQMYVFESISILANLIIITIILIKAGHVKTRISIRVVNIFLWVLVVLFGANTVGNLFSTNSLETIIFTPLTFISSIMCYRLAIEKQDVDT